MTDIARLGFSADTAELKKAKADLEALVPSANKAADAARKVGAATDAAAPKTSKLGAAAGGAAAGTTKLGAAATGVASNLSKIPAAANGATTSLNRLGNAANDNINRLQSTPGNVAAQFQDIGVTAAAGMNPMLIALQQGTQLSAAMTGGIGTLWAGIKQLLNPMSLLTIAVVAVIAVVIQMAMEFFAAGKEAKTLSERIDDVQFSSYALSDAQSILGGVIDMTTGKINTQSNALIALARAQAIAGRIKAQAERAEARNSLVEMNRGEMELVGGFGGGISFQRQYSAEGNIAGLVASGVYTYDQGIKKLDELLEKKQITEDKFLEAAQSIVKFGVADENKKVFEDSLELLNGQISGNEYLLKPEKPKARRSGKSEAEKLAEAYGDIVVRAKAAAAALRVEEQALGMSEAAALAYRNEQDLLAQATAKGIMLTADQANELRNLAAAITDAEVAKEIALMTKAFEDQQRTLSDNAALIGLTGRDLDYVQTYQNMLNDAIERGIPITEEYNQKLRERAGLIADMTGDNREAEFMSDIVKGHERNIDALRREAGEYGLTGAALTAYRYETDLLLDAKRQGIVLSQTDIDLIRQQAAEYGELTEAIRKQSEELEFRKDVFRGVLGDMVSGLQQGKTVWEAFGDAVLRVVDRIIQKLLDLATDQMFDQLLNLAGSVGGALGGGGSKSVGNVGGGIKSIVKNADGNAFDNSGITRFAKGGAFTNGIYDSPTLFKFAKGGALGEMGEAGPEAVMPLKRGPDGSLGVQVHGTGGPQEVHVVVTTNDERFDAYTDERISDAAPSIMEGSVALTSKRGSFRQSRSLA